MINIMFLIWQYEAEKSKIAYAGDGYDKDICPIQDI